MPDPTPDPPEDPFGRLIRTHRDIEAQVAELARAAEQVGDPARQGAALSAIATVLDYFEGPAARHHADEEHTLFPRLRPLAAFAQMLAAFDFQHQLNDTTFAELRVAYRAVGPGAPGAPARLRDVARRFVEMQRAHLMAEERALFPLATTTLSADVVREMAAEMAARAAT